MVILNFLIILVLFYHLTRRDYKFININRFDNCFQDHFLVKFILKLLIFQCYYIGKHNTFLRTHFSFDSLKLILIIKHTNYFILVF